MKNEPISLRYSSNKENIDRKRRTRCPTRNIMEEEAMERLNQLSQVDANRLNGKCLDGFTAWNKAQDGQNNQSQKQFKETLKTQHNSNQLLKVKFRRFSFWKKSQVKVEENNQKMNVFKEHKRYLMNSSMGKQFNDAQTTQKVSSNEIFVRKFPRKDKSHIQLAKKYFVNDALKEDMSHTRAKSFQSQSRTMFVSKRRPKTGASSTNLSRMSNDFSRNDSYDKPHDPKFKLNKLIAESEKMMRRQKEKKKAQTKKLQRDVNPKNNPFFRILKEKYKYFAYVSESK